MTSKRAVDKLDCYIDTWEICGDDNFTPATNITKEDYEAFKIARKAIKQIGGALTILERYKLRIPPTVYDELVADIMNIEEEE